MPKVSVIIPCYNQGMFLDEAVESVLAQTFDDLEIIIVNDGSDDIQTIEQCDSYDDSRIKVLTTTNQGLAAARNNGISQADGKYILPLDSDDKIASEYVSEAVRTLESDSQTGIVYCQAKLFGAVEGDWKLPEYSLHEMLRDNIIFCTAMFRKSDWQTVGGFDAGMIYGWEDYDFWLSLIEKELKVHQLKGRYFYYRFASDSMVRSKEKSQKIEMFKRIFHRHQKLFSDHIDIWLEQLLEVREPYLTCKLYVDCGEGLSDSNSIVRKIEPGKRTIRFPVDSFKNRKELRFDPAECPVCIEIEAVVLVTETGETSIDLETLDSNAVIRDGNRFMFSTEDPQIFPDIDEKVLRKIYELIIIFDLVAHGAEALKKIIDFQKKESDVKKRPISFARLFRTDS